MVTMNDGCGGAETAELVGRIRDILGFKGRFSGVLEDGAYTKIGDKYLVFTTDSYTVEPLFFKGGDIGKMSACGTINDLCVMGAKPIGLSLSLVIEEGFGDEELFRIIGSVKNVCSSVGVPVVTGDTKVLPNGEVPGIIINSAGVGMADRIIPNSGIDAGDKIIVSGSVGDHGAAILSKRFGYDSNIASDCAPIYDAMEECGKFIKACKDPTRGGLSACLNELADKSGVGIRVDERSIPVKSEVRAICDMLGVDPLESACEGRFVCGVKSEDAEKTLEILRRFNPDACVIGEAFNGRKVLLKTEIGDRFMNMPAGGNVPRIC